MNLFPNHDGGLSLVPGSVGQYCPDNPDYCDECDYLICCFDNDLCAKCFAENGACEIKARSYLIPQASSVEEAPASGG